MKLTSDVEEYKEVNIIDPNPNNSYKTKKNFTGSYTEVNPLEFGLNCKQRLTFLPDPLSDNRFMSVDAAWFRLCKNPMNCLLSMNKSDRRCVFCTVSKT